MAKILIGRRDPRGGSPVGDVLCSSSNDCNLFASTVLSRITAVLFAIVTAAEERGHALGLFGFVQPEGRRLHSSQELIEMPGGTLRVRLRLDSLEEAEKWVLSLGTHATVIRPDKLRERLSEATEELWQRYGWPMVMHDA